MALKKQMADGTEGRCYICGHEISAGEIVIAKPGTRVGKPLRFVCNKPRCNPSSAKTHHSRKNYRYK